MPQPNAEEAYRDLVSRMVDDEPRHGWTAARDLPYLLIPDVEVVKAARPQQLMDEFCLDGDRLLDAVADLDATMVIGFRMVQALEAAARAVIWHDVYLELEQRRQDRWEQENGATQARAHRLARAIITGLSREVRS